MAANAFDPRKNIPKFPYIEFPNTLFIDHFKVFVKQKYTQYKNIIAALILIACLYINIVFGKQYVSYIDAKFHPIQFISCSTDKHTENIVKNLLSRQKITVTMRHKITLVGHFNRPLAKQVICGQKRVTLWLSALLLNKQLLIEKIITSLLLRIKLLFWFILKFI